MGKYKREQAFCKRYDRYAKNVTLTYKKSGVFETTIGGCCSIISFIILAYWLAVNIFFSVADYGTFSVQETTTLTQDVYGDYPKYELDKYDLLLAFRIRSISGLEQAEIEKYVQGVYF